MTAALGSTMAKGARGMKLECNRCEQPIDIDRAVWLEFDNTLGRYFKPGEMPDDHESLGGYPFGKACAAAILVAHE